MTSWSELNVQDVARRLALKSSPLCLDHIVNQAQIQEELGVLEVVCEWVCEWLDTHRRLDTERVPHHIRHDHGRVVCVESDRAQSDSMQC